MKDAPLLEKIADGPPGGRALWMTAADGVRVRVVCWPQEGARGTVLLLPGRTEYAEKYGRAASDLGTRGYGTLTLDWRGQGLSDRITGDSMTGHVSDFIDYQADLDALLEVARLRVEGGGGVYWAVERAAQRHPEIAAMLRAASV